MPSILASALVGFYRVWHGRLHLKGAGLLLKSLAPALKSLQCYPLKLPEGQTIVVDFTDISAFYWLNDLLGEPFEEEALIQAMSRVAPSGAVIWDVGANGGLFAYRLFRSAKPQSLHFFEPNPIVFALAANAAAPFAQVHGHQVALSNHSGSAQLAVARGLSGLATMEPESTGRPVNVAQIECRVADELVEAGLVPPPALIKIDTEGHEISVLQGMTRLIARHRPWIFFEHLSLTDEEIVGATPAGYELFSVSDRDGSLAPGLNRERGHNSAFRPRPA